MNRLDNQFLDVTDRQDILLRFGFQIIEQSLDQSLSFSDNLYLALRFEIERKTATKIRRHAIRKRYGNQISRGDSILSIDIVCDP